MNETTTTWRKILRFCTFVAMESSQRLVAVGKREWVRENVTIHLNLLSESIKNFKWKWKWGEHKRGEYMKIFFHGITTANSNKLKLDQHFSDNFWAKQKKNEKIRKLKTSKSQLLQNDTQFAIISTDWNSCANKKLEKSEKWTKSHKMNDRN